MTNSVRLVAITKPVLDEITSSGEFVAFAARVSNPANQYNSSTSGRLLNYLREQKHWSPFEMAHAVFEISTTRDIARQILRHRSFSFQEFSQRYAQATEFQLSDARRQDVKNRQNSIDDMDEETREWWNIIQQEQIDRSERMYLAALHKGIAKECARKVLPEGLTMSTLYMAGSFRSWIHYLEQRCDPATQLEHRVVAEAIREILRKEVPEVFGNA